jgi:tRNA-2-methylthio-N6-dimethylallyladenosine synthase
MNERDSESVSARLQALGFTATDDETLADIVIVNTCSVRGKAEEKALGKLRLLVGRPGSPGPRAVGAVGCMVQRLQSDIFKKVPGLGFAIGTHRMGMLAQVLDLVLSGRTGILEASEDRTEGDVSSGHIVQGPSAFVTILLGCDRRCAYCVVPQVRGREWSRPAAEVLDEIRVLAASGVRDVTLLGQSVISYGRRNPVWPGEVQSPGGFSEPLPRLLEAAGRIPGILRVRFTSGHPSGCTPELIRAMAEVPAVCEHLHLPLQSGSDRILGLMGRGYTSEEYRAAIRCLRAAVPSVALTTDIIVGFPSETVAEFEETSRFMDEIGFDNAFIFKYSPRPGTRAADMTDDVPYAEKLRRNRVLLAEQDRRARALHERLHGQTLEVLVEGVSPRNPKRWTGRSRTNKIVVFEPPPGLQVGDRVQVTVRRSTAQTLYGEAESGMDGKGSG